MKYICLSLPCIWLIALSPLSSPGFAEPLLNDPTRPVYEQNSSLTGMGLLGQIKTLETIEIPVLTQLIYSKTRQVAFFGDVIVRAGDTTDFGIIKSIKKDRVLIEQAGIVAEVVFFEQKPKQLKDKTVEVAL